ncbi:unnamed protein product [Amoebophrya sp. A25]|nr:unnamed protein product [Amoebophrya sp. A25]|eukprot:GSA25T00014974001.1
MSYNFASSGYYSCFGNVPEADGARLRRDTATYMKKFDKQAWSNAPICTVLNGRDLTEGSMVDTVDAFERVNGKQILAQPYEVDQVIGHILNYRPPVTDLRAPIRAIDALFCDELAPEIIGNQSIDFSKQDGITEIEESIQANLVEQRINDHLYAAETSEVEIRRNPVFIGCVSNFSNFLDLFRKTLRHLELGVPVVVLSRSNTTQHMFRWFRLLQNLCEKFSVDSGMLTYLSCSIAEQRRVFLRCPGSPMHFTGSREIAGKIKEVCPKIFASTGGPNTLVATGYNDKVGDAVRWSNLIENKGQCTALRHFVCPSVTETDLNACYAKAPVLESSLQSVEQGEFAGILTPCAEWSKSRCKVPDGYKQMQSQPLINYRISPSLPVSIQEQWRQLYVDVTTPECVKDASFLSSLAVWLNREQPISLAINEDSAAGMEVAKKLFAMTGMVVYTVGTMDKPALTAQARPQDGEVFGEFPPRRQLQQYTHAPMVVPSGVAAYNAVYKESFLQAKATKPGGLTGVCGSAVQVWSSIQAPLVRGYAAAILDYLVDATKAGPRRGFGARTTYFGLQRPPVSAGNATSAVQTVLRCEQDVDRALLLALPFVATNARDSLVLSAAPSVAATLEKVLAGSSATLIPIRKESHAEFASKVEKDPSWYNVIYADADMEFMLAQQFISRLLPLGHVKSTSTNDEKFYAAFATSEKWLRMLPQGSSSLC